MVCTITYILRKRLGRLELKLFVPGENEDFIIAPVDDPDAPLEFVLSKFAVNRSISAHHLYFYGENIILISSPQQYLDTGFLKNPMLIAMLLGILCGLLCLLLPEDIRSYIVDQVASPLHSLYSKVLGGITGPMMFLSLVISISALDSISQLNTIGLKIIGRFVLITLMLIILSMGVSLLFFHDFPAGTIELSTGSLMDIVLSIIPTNLFQPFLENSLSQLMVIAFGVGAALLLLGERTAGVKRLLEEISLCLSALWGFVRKIIVVVPFLGLFCMVAARRFHIIAYLWQYAAVLLLCMVIAAAFKLLIVSLRLKVSLFLLRILPYWHFLPSSSPWLLRDW